MSRLIVGIAVLFFSVVALGSGGTSLGGGGGGTWGSITGTLSAQTDLDTALTAKAPKDSPVFTNYAKFGNYHLEPSANAVGNCGASKTIDLSLSNTISLTLDQATCTLTFSNPQDRGVYVFILTEDVTGSRVVTWPGTVAFPDAVTPTLSGSAKVDVISCLYVSAIPKYYCSSSLNF